MEGLQNLAGKIEELKDKLTDGEYKDLLDTAKECYEKKEEEKTKKKFMKVLCITSSVDTVYTRTPVDSLGGGINPGAMSSGERCVWYEYDDELEDYEGPVEKFSFIAKARQEEKVILFEIGSVNFRGFCIDRDICKMTNYAYDKLLKDKYIVDDGKAALDDGDRHPTTYVYLSHYEL